MAISVKLRHTVLIVVISVVSAIAGQTIVAQAEDADVQKLTVQSHPETQDQIQATLDAFQLGDSSEAFRQLGSLRSLDPHEVVRQLAIFAAEVGDGEQVLRTRRILDLLNIQPAIVIDELAPYIDADEPNLRSFVRDWFEYHDQAAAPGPGLPSLQPVNYNDYKDYVRGKLIQNEDVPESFIEYIYEKLPGHALLVFYFAHGQKERGAFLAENVIRNTIWLRENGFDEEFQKELPGAKDELRKMAKHNEWWVRLYVAEIMREHAELRDVGVVEQLSDDSNDLVARAAKKEAKPARQMDNPDRAKAYEKLKQMIEARKAAAPNQ